MKQSLPVIQLALHSRNHNVKELLGGRALHHMLAALVIELIGTLTKPLSSDSSERIANNYAKSKCSV